VQVYLDDLDPGAVQVELYADGQNGGEPFRKAMASGGQGVGLAGSFVYSTQVSSARPAADYTPRIVPFHAGVSVPLEAPFILWRDPVTS
jgi:starch phosphorylase